MANQGLRHCVLRASLPAERAVVVDLVALEEGHRTVAVAVDSIAVVVALALCTYDAIYHSCYGGGPEPGHCWFPAELEAARTQH